ncbi:RraA family protein [Flagellimonas taeanensis]|uniref:RraA family protein n=1 Tax=Flavobacteriaceae TaxID=49546 RepID=UPI000E69D190|nr:MULTISPECIES: RraA family protein [Allomuricauda]MDC6386621.1 RraA family protein [Muricauda sp. SK9]RIV51334.1 RraA family protein [Allomuricauda taeanensis]
MKSLRIVLVLSCFLGFFHVRSQGVTASPEYIKELTSNWTGERFADGRPKVSDALLQRMKNIQIEEAWGFLRRKGYNNQYEGEWEIIHPESAMTGRVVTAQYMPLRPDYQQLVKLKGAKENRDTIGGSNSWPIQQLVHGDVYVADGYGRIIDGTLIGSNLGNAIYANSKNGVIFDGGVRDVAGLLDIEGFNGWYKGADPSYLQEEMLTSINMPIRVGRAIVLPGDVVLANQHGTVFIPSHLASELVLSSEIVGLRDLFGFQRLREKKYTAGQIDTRWTKEINADFENWLKEYPDSKLPMTRKELNDYMASKKD